MKRPELLVVSGGDLAGRRFAVLSQGLRLGRASTNDIAVPDEELSRSHCLFEAVGDDGLRLTDLASANGTYLNGRPLGSDPAALSPGDEIAAGQVRLKVVRADAPDDAGAAVDLGLGHPPAAADASPAPSARRRPLAVNVLWGAAVLLTVVAISLILFWDEAPFDALSARAPTTRAVVPEKERVVEMRYEKIVADSAAVFRYCMTLSPDGTLRVAIDDVSDEKRHLDKPKKITPAARERLNEILLDPEFSTLAPAYAGPDGEPPELKSWTLRVVYSGRVKDVRIVNAPEPEAFRRIREKLEVFSKNELGIWAIQRTRAQLIALAGDCAETGKMKWEDRDVEHGNLSRAIAAYREAIFYLDTVNPKPPAFADYQQALETAVRELAKRFEDRRFRADRAINLQDWETAREELKILCRLVPDRDDDRYREAAAKLVDVEKKLIKGGGR